MNVRYMVYVLNIEEIKHLDQMSLTLMFRFVMPQFRSSAFTNDDNFYTSRREKISDLNNSRHLRRTRMRLGRLYSWRFLDANLRFSIRAIRFWLRDLAHLLVFEAR